MIAVVILLLMSLASAEIMAEVMEDDFNFDDTNFAGEFVEENILDPDSTGADGDFLKDFVFKLDQQIYGQVIHHDASTTEKSSPQGLENNRLNLLINYQNAFADTWLLQGSAQMKLFWAGDYENGAHNSPNLMEVELGDFIELRLNELFVQKSLAQHSFKLGRQTIVWGEVENNSVLDIINTSEFRDLSVIEVEDARLNQLMLLWEHYNDNYKMSAFFNFYPEFNPLPRRGSPLFVEIDFNLQSPQRDQFLYEVGSQIRWSFAASDISLMAAYLYENSLRFDFSDDANDLPAKINDYWMVGLSANRAIGQLLLKFDAVYNHGVLVDTLIGELTPSTVVKNQLGSSLGLDYSINSKQAINASVSGFYYLKQDADLSEQQLINEGLIDRWRLRYSHDFYNNEWVFSSIALGSMADKNLLASVMLNYAVDDNWLILGQVIATWASAESSVAVLDNDLRLGVTARYSF